MGPMLNKIIDGLKAADLTALKRSPKLLHQYVKDQIEACGTEGSLSGTPSASNHNFPNISAEELMAINPYSKEEAGLTSPAAPECLASLREIMKEHKAEGYLLSTNDEYLSEYTPLYAKRLYYLTGFSGSYGFCVVLRNKAAVFVDGRYTAQAKAQVNTSMFEIIELSISNIINFITSNLTPSKVTPAQANVAAKEASASRDHNSANLSLLVNAKIFSYEFVSCLNKALIAQSISLNTVSKSFIDNYWDNQPPRPLSPIFLYPADLAGETAEKKLQRVRNYLKTQNLDSMIVTALDSIAWLLNLRASDVRCSPLAVATVIVCVNGQTKLFTNPLAITPSVAQELAKLNIECLPSHNLGYYLTNLQDQAVGLSQESPYYYFEALKGLATTTILPNDHISDLKVQKNPTEINNTKLAHRLDGTALTKLIMWINHQLATHQPLDELTISAQLDRIKEDIKEYRGPSFDSIVAVGSNAAYPHYQSTPATNLKLQLGTPILIDSGAQYIYGTTDVTRTLSCGPVKGSLDKNFKQKYTLVLKGLIALSMVKFPKNTPCKNLDALARQFLWQIGEDYAHGTGHGVGHYLGVHEGPIRFNQTCDYPIKPGMIFSIEPGYYKVGGFGIRIENLVVTTETKSDPNFLEFETLTLAPIDTAALDLSLMSHAETNWLNDYHHRVYKELAPRLGIEERQQLKILTQPLKLTQCK